MWEIVGKVGNSGEKLRKVGKSCKSGDNLAKVGKIGEKGGKMAKSVENTGQIMNLRIKTCLKLIIYLLVFIQNYSNI